MPEQEVDMYVLDGTRV